MKVRYLGFDEDQVKWAGDDPRLTLETGKEYKVVHTFVSSWSTTYELKGVDGEYNSVMFEEI